MDLGESGVDGNSIESEPGDDDKSTESESGDDDNSTESESRDDDNSTDSTENSTNASTTKDVLDDMILEVYNTEDYATKLSKYVMNDYQNAENNAKRDHTRSSQE